MNDAMGSRFSIIAKTRPTLQDVKLFSQLDRDSDGQIAKRELDEFDRLMRQFDLNDDELLGLDELVADSDSPIRQFVDRNAVEVLDQPFVLVGSETPVNDIAARLLKQYDRAVDEPGGKEPENNLLEPHEIGFEQTQFSRFDADANGSLDLVELAQLLRDPLPQLQLRVQLSHRRAGRPKLSLVHSSSPAKIDVERKAPHWLRFVIAGEPVEFRAMSSRYAARDNTSLYKLRFRTSDKDKNQYLDNEEFGGLQLAASFDAVDRDSDGKLFKEEVVAYVEQQAAMSQGRLEMTVTQDRRSIFGEIDGDYDRRLSPRERAAAFGKLSPLDLNGDGRIAATELSGQYKITLGVGKPPLFQTQMTANNRGSGTVSVPPPSDGPIWFRKMDANRDRDVSRREFFGSKQAFNRIDSNGDGLLSVEEAEATAQE